MNHRTAPGRLRKRQVEFHFWFINSLYMNFSLREHQIPFSLEMVAFHQQAEWEWCNAAQKLGLKTTAHGKSIPCEDLSLVQLPRMTSYLAIATQLRQWPNMNISTTKCDTETFQLPFKNHTALHLLPWDRFLITLLPLCTWWKYFQPFLGPLIHH